MDMDVATKTRLAKDLCDSIRDELVRDISAGKLPEHWNGIQLRALLAERFARNRMGREGDRRFWRDYRNEVITHNL